MYSLFTFKELRPYKRRVVTRISQVGEVESLLSNTFHSLLNSDDQLLQSVSFAQVENLLRSSF